MTGKAGAWARRHLQRIGSEANIVGVREGLAIPAEFGSAENRRVLAAEKARRILMLSSVPLAAPWNGGDKNMSRTLVWYDRRNAYVVQTGLTDEWPDDRVTAVRLVNPDTLPTPTAKLRALSYLARYSGSVDLIHLVATLHRPTRWIGRAMRAWSKLVGKPIVHTIPSLGALPLAKHSFFADATVVLSEDAAMRLRRHGVENVYRVYPPLASEMIQPRVDPQQVRRELRLEHEAVLYASHYGDDSGVVQLLRAFASLPAELDRVALVLACRAHRWQNVREEEAKVWALARALGIDHRVRVLGPVDDMAALILASDVTVLTPERLGSKMDLPLVVLESLALERPVVVADYPPLNEAVLGGGLAVSFGDEDGLTAALSRLLNGPSWRRELGRRGRAEVLRRCDPQRVAGQYQAIYAQVSAGRR